MRAERRLGMSTDSVGLLFSGAADHPVRRRASTVRSIRAAGLVGSAGRRHCGGTVAWRRRRPDRAHRGIPEPGKLRPWTTGRHALGTIGSAASRRCLEATAGPTARFRLIDVGDAAAADIVCFWAGWGVRCRELMSRGDGQARLWPRCRQCRLPTDGQAAGPLDQATSRCACSAAWPGSALLISVAGWWRRLAAGEVDARSGESVLAAVGDGLGVAVALRLR